MLLTCLARRYQFTIERNQFCVRESGDTVSGRAIKGRASGSSRLEARTYCFRHITRAVRQVTDRPLPGNAYKLNEKGNNSEKWKKLGSQLKADSVVLICFLSLVEKA